MANETKFESSAKAGYQWILSYSHTTDITKNLSSLTVSYALKKVANNNTSYNTYGSTVTIKIDGETYTKSGITFDLRKSAIGTTKTLFTKTVNIPHNSDGTKSVNISATHDTDIELEKQTISGTIELNKIPRDRSTLSMSSDTVECGKSIMFNVNSVSDLYKYSITANFYDQKIIVATNENKKSIEWTVPIELASLMKTEASHVATVTIETFNGTKSLGSKSYLLTLEVPKSMAPEVKIIVTEGDDRVTGDKFIATVSDLVCRAEIVESYDSEIMEVLIGKDYEVQGTEVIYYNVSAGDHVIHAKVTDSRGRVTNVSKTVHVMEYEEIKINECDIADLEKNNSGYYQLRINNINATSKQPATLKIEIEADGKLYTAFNEKSASSNFELVNKSLNTGINDNVDISDAKIIVTWSDDYSEANRYINLSKTKGMASEVSLNKQRFTFGEQALINVECNQERIAGSDSPCYVDTEYSFPEIGISGKISKQLQLNSAPINKYTHNYSFPPGTMDSLNINGITKLHIDVKMKINFCIRSYSTYTGMYYARVCFGVTFGNGTFKYYYSTVSWPSRRDHNIGRDTYIDEIRVIPLGISLNEFISNKGIQSIKYDAPRSSYYGDNVASYKSNGVQIDNGTIINVTREVSENEYDTTDFIRYDIFNNLIVGSDRFHKHHSGFYHDHHDLRAFTFSPYGLGMDYFYDYERDDDFRYYFTIVVPNLNKNAIYSLCLDTVACPHRDRGAKTIKITTVDGDTVLYNKKSELHNVVIEGVTGIRIWFYGNTHLRFIHGKTFMKQIGWRKSTASVSSSWNVPDLNQKMKNLNSTEGTITSTVYNTGSTTTVVEKVVRIAHVDDRIYHGYYRDHNHFVPCYEQDPCTKGCIDISSLDDNSYIDVEIEDGDMRSIIFTNGLPGSTNVQMLNEIIPSGRKHRLPYDILKNMMYKGCRFIYFSLPWAHRHCKIKYTIYRVIKTDPIKITSKAPVTLYVPESEVPFINNMTIEEANDEVTKLDVKGFIAGKTKLKIDISATSNINSYAELKYSTTISGATVKHYNGNSFVTDVIQDPGIYRIETIVEDTRGRTAKSTKQIVVLTTYEPPKVEIKAIRCDYDGNPSENGACAKINASMSNLNNIEGTGHMTTFIIRGYNINAGSEIIVENVENVSSHEVINKIVEISNDDWVFEAVAIDAFKKEVIKKVPVKSVSYIEPAISITGYRSNRLGDADSVGTCAKITVTADANITNGLPMIVKLLYAPQNSKEYEEVVLAVDTMSYNNSVILTELKNVGYNVILVVTDALLEKRTNPIEIVPGTNFDIKGIEYDGRFKSTVINTPDDIRSRVNSLSDVYDIPLPYNGLIFYNLEDETHYIANKLGSVESNGLILENRIVDDYRKLKADKNYINKESYYDKNELNEKIKILHDTIEGITKTVTGSEMSIDYLKVITNPLNQEFMIIWHIPYLLPGNDPGDDYKIHFKMISESDDRYISYTIEDLINKGMRGEDIKVVRNDEYFVYSGKYVEDLNFYISFGNYRSNVGTIKYNLGGE